jgi:hypothetical protein
MYRVRTLLGLADLDAQKLWRELGYTSLFYYCRGEFKLSKGAAQNRKTAAELIQKFPEVAAAFRSGQLCLSTVNEVAKVLTPENREEVLPRFFGLSRREAEEVAVSLRPVEVVPVREVVTAIRSAASALRACPAVPFAPAGVPLPPVHLDEPAAPVPVPAPVFQMVQVIQEPPRYSVEPLDAELSRLKEPRPSRTDAIPSHVKREAWRRAGGRCEWRFESGERCGCTRRLEFDHIRPLARGGASTLDNIRVTCRPHNLLAARRVFGDEVMDRYARGCPKPPP